MSLADPTSPAIKPNSLRPGTNADGKLSLIRERIGESNAKQAAQTHVHKGGTFWGFGAAEASKVSAHGENLENHPVPFDGHVNLKLGYPTPPNTPDMPEEMNETYAFAIDKLRSLAAEYAVFADPNPLDPAWTGPSLRVA